MAEPRHVLVWSVGYGGGHARVAAALTDHLVRQYPDRVRVASVDILERHLPRLKALASVAYRNSAGFFPSGFATLAELSARRADDPVVRELVSGGLAGLESALDAFRPDAVVSVHPLAAGVAAELGARFDYASISVMTDQGLGSWWLHPGTSLHCVANSGIREALALAGVAWDRIALTGVPVADGVRPAADRRAARKLVGLADKPTAILMGRSDGPGPPAIAHGLAAAGVQVIVARAGAISGEQASGPIRVVPPSEALRLLSSADSVVCLGGGSALWTAPVAGVPLVIVEPAAAMEGSNADYLVNSGAALLARDDADAIERVRFLIAHPGRERRMSEDAAAVGRPSAVKAVSERVLAALG